MNDKIKIIINSLFLGLILFVFYYLSTNNFLLFHTLAELFSIVIACGIFMFAWNSRQFMDNNYLLFLGIAYLFIASLDIFHTLTYKGMNIFIDSSAGLTTQLWIAARYVESLSLLIAPIFFTRKLEISFIFFSYFIIISILLIAIFSGIFPDCYIENVGLTPFKINSEYIISSFLLISLFILHQKRNQFDLNILRLIFASILITILAELSFTFYIDMYGFSNFVGHILKIISFYFIYKAIIEIGITKPYRLLFKSLIEKEKSLEQAKEKAEIANRAKSKFLANMSHELRTPIHAVLGFTDLIKRDSPTPNQLENLQIISHSGEHLLYLINDVLETSKIEAGRTTFNEESADFHQILKDVTEMMRIRAEHKHLQFILDYELTLEHFIKTDVGKLRQILINLIGNSIKFTKNGRINLRVRSQRLEKNKKCQIFFEIEDTGEGIAKQDLNTIFDSFVQVGKRYSGSEGTGLGLHITKNYIQMLGGNIEVISELGTGSLFKFFILVKIAKLDDIEQKIVSNKIIGLSPKQTIPRILIVDDNSENRLLLEKILGRIGFETEEAVNGKEAIIVFEQWQPHLIFMDMYMPIMDGYEATKLIKANLTGKEIVIIALTANIFEEENSKIMAIGCDDLLHKPYCENELLEMISKYLNLEYFYENQKQQVKTIFDEKSILSTWLIISEDLRNKFYQALKELDMDSIELLFVQVAKQNIELAKAMQPYIDNFKYEQLAELLDNKLG
ncbi:MAG: response regulator [Thiomargarita sp.]|nr:response regulator [Thiomargarita sp.]